MLAMNSLFNIRVCLTKLWRVERVTCAGWKRRDTVVGRICSPERDELAIPIMSAGRVGFQLIPLCQTN
jgi:hypothetical protein